ncbi:MAG: hypothetical protein ACREEM_49015 [Blastocatellia bacterium]
MIKTKKPLLPPKAKRTFFDYFKMTVEAPEIIQSFGYSYEASHLSLPRAGVEAKRLQELRERLDLGQTIVTQSNEIARRKFLIAPVLLEAAARARARISVEYPLEVDNQLRGTLDYFLRGENTLLVVEAKNADLERGFAQLSVELIALDKWLAAQPAVLHGAVSIGNIWQFGLLNRRSKRITQDLALYRSPEDLAELLGAVIAILTNAGKAKRKSAGASSSKNGK